MAKLSDRSVGTAGCYPETINSIIVNLRLLVEQIDLDFKQARGLILEIARRLDEGHLCERSRISRKIKHVLRDKIQEGKITEKWIEECLAPEYKRRYVKSELSSLSEENAKKIENNLVCTVEKSDPSSCSSLDCNANSNGSSNSTKSVKTFLPLKREAESKELLVDPASSLGQITVQPSNHNSWDNSESEGTDLEHREGCGRCQVLQQKCGQLQLKLEEYEEVIKIHTSITTAEQILHKSNQDYAESEFSVLLEPLRQHVIAAFNSNRSVERVWFTAKLNNQTGKIMDVRIRKASGITEFKKENKASDNLSSWMTP